MSSPIEVRLAIGGDYRFVAASWFESYWKATAREQGISREAYQRGMDARINRLIKRSVVLVAAAREYPDEILGYAVVEAPGTLHYVYVKSAYRRHGVAKGLVRGRATKFSHKTHAGKHLTQGMEFDPFTAE